MQISNVMSSIKSIETTTGLLVHNAEYILQVLQILQKAKENSNTVFVVGNGGSASTATHMVCDLFKASEMKALCLNDCIPLTTALTNDIGWNNVYSYQLNRLAEEGDVLIVFSVHGGKGIDDAGIQSTNLVDAIDIANSIGMITIGISSLAGGFDNCCCSINVQSDLTPVVESVHSAIAHIIPFLIKQE